MRWRLQGTQTVIDWVQGFSSFGPPALFNWMSQISSFKRIKFTHVYHEQNQSVDSLSKRGRTTMPRQIFFSILLDGSINNSGAFSFKAFLFPFAYLFVQVSAVSSFVSSPWHSRFVFIEGPLRF